MNKKMTEKEHLHKEIDDLKKRLGELKASESQLKNNLKACYKSESNYHTLVDSMIEGLCIADENESITFTNDSMAKILGYQKAEEVIGRNLGEFCSGEQLEIFKKETIKRRKGEKEKYDAEIIRSDGEKRIINITPEPVFDADGVFIGTSGLLMDVTEQRSAEEALRESEERFKQVAESAGEWIWETDADGLYIYSSPVVEKILGYTPEEVVGKKYFYDFISPDVKQDLKKSAFEIFSRKNTFNKFTNANLHKNGNIVILETSGVPILDENGQLIGYRGVDTDVTAQKKAEQELFKAQKLESIGLLAGGIAHDFNNIITAILGNIQIAKMIGTEKEETIKILSNAEKACLHASNLTRQLLTFSKGGAPVKEPIFLSTHLEDMANLALRGSNVACVSSIVDDLWPVEVDVGQITQVIHNIVINADQAMPGGGKITLRAENIVISEHDGLSLESGSYVKISIQDKGIGIPKENQMLIFDPYFTTKQKGSGLGLTICYSIIKNHDGFILVESEVGNGTTFHVLLPVSKQMPIQDVEDLLEGAVENIRVLLMDDNEFIRESANLLFRKIHCFVETADDGAEAIEKYRQAKESGQPFTVVIMDLTIPGGMGGVEATEKLLKYDYDAKVIVSSGYSTDPIMANFREYGFCDVLVKPYTMNKVRDVLGRIIKSIAP